MDFLIFLILNVIIEFLAISGVKSLYIKSAIYGGRLFGVVVPAANELFKHKLKSAIFLPLAIILFLIAGPFGFQSMFSGYFFFVFLIFILLFVIFVVVLLASQTKIMNECVEIGYRNSYPILAQGLAQHQIAKDIHLLAAQAERIYVSSECIKFKRFDNTVVYINYYDYQYENLSKEEMTLLTLYIYCSYKNEFNFSLSMMTIPGDCGRTTYGFVGGKLVFAKQAGTPDTRLLMGYNIFRKPGVIANAAIIPVNAVTPPNNTIPFQQNEVTYKFCTKCGATLSSDVAFCASCGTRQG